MPGIVGIQGSLDQQAVDTLMGEMIGALGAKQGDLVDCFAANQLGLGRVHLGIIDNEPQPLWSADGDVAVVMTGEIYSWDQLPQLPSEQVRNGALPEFSNARILLAAYLAYGEAFVDHVNGNFSAAIWNSGRQLLLLVTDHIGSYPLYYAQLGDVLVFASGARAVARAPGLRREVDAAALAEMLAYDHLFGDKTLFCGVHLVPPGTILRFERGALSQSKYIDLQFPQDYDLYDEAYYIDGWVERVQQAVARRARGPAPVGVLLSGGLDSRTILGLLVENGMEVRTSTFGIPGCDDEMSARAMAQLLGLPHKFVPLAPDYLAQYAAEAVRLTDGQKSAVHFHVLAGLDGIAQDTSVVYKGYLGGNHGETAGYDRLAPARPEVWFERVFYARNSVFAENTLPLLYTDAMYRTVKDVPRESLWDALDRSHSSWWVDKDGYVYLHNSNVRLFSLGVELARSRTLVRTPLADRDLLRFTLTVPAGLRADKSYYRKAIAKALPTLAKVDYARTRRPVKEGCFRTVQKHADELARYWLRDRGLNWVSLPKERPYADYNSWMRNELRTWVEAILLDPRSLNRGYFQPAFIRNLVAEHMAGHNHARRLGVLLSLELWHQQFVD